MNQGFHSSAKSFGASLSHWLIALSLLVTSLSFAQDNDPSAMWYRAFLTYESTLELEKKGDYLHAINKCNEAKALYDGLAYSFPQFQPDIVKFKQKIVSDTRQRIIESNRIKQQGGNPNQRPNVPPAPDSRQTVPRQAEYPNVDVPPPYNGGNGRGTQITQPAPRPWKDNSGNVLPDWSQNPRVGGAANDLLNQVSREEQRKDSIIRELNQENLKLKAELNATQSRLRSAESHLAQSRLKQQEYRRQLETYERDPNSQNFVGKVQQYKALLKETMADLQASTDLNARLLGDLRRAQDTIKRQNSQIKALEAERDNLAKVIQGKGVGAEALNDLMEQNKRLSERLVLLEKVAQRTSTDNRQKEQDIALLKSEVDKVRVERDRLVVESVKHQQEIEGLQKKLEMLSDGLSDNDKEALANMAPEQKAENELLRSMVLKQLQRQAHLKHSKELLLRQLDRVGARSSALMEVVEDMARGTQLTPEEKALFRAPQLQELLASTSPMEKTDGTLRAPANPLRGTVNQRVAVELSQLEKSARLDFQEGRYDEAEQSFLKYLHFKPRNVACLCNLGILKLAVSDYGAAQHYLQKAVAIDKSSGHAFYLLGRTYFLQEKYEDALSNLEQGIQLQPSNAKAHNCVGVIASQKGWASRAEKAFSEAVKIDPKFGDAHFNLAVLFSTKGQDDFEKAYKHYYKALEEKVPRDASIEQYLKVKNAERLRVGMR